MTKTITKEQFRDMAMPIRGNGKEITEAKLELHPCNTGKINGNIYKITVNDLENTVTMEKQDVE